MRDHYVLRSPEPPAYWSGRGWVPVRDEAAAYPTARAAMSARAFLDTDRDVVVVRVVRS